MMEDGRVDNVIEKEECEFAEVEDAEDAEHRNIQPTDSVSDEEYDELCGAVLKRRKKNLEDRPGYDPDEQQEDQQNEEEVLQDIDDEQQQQTGDRHHDLVTPELSAEDKELAMPPKLSHKRSHKKRSPQDDRRKRSGRKLEYQSLTQSEPRHKAIKRKLLPKSDPKLKENGKHSSSKKKKLQERTVHEAGTWVQCMRSECSKWRYLSDVTDPALIPEYWVCEMNTDSVHNSCDHPEEDYDSLEFVFTKFTEGSVVWAKMQGFPWWPAIVEEDPDTATYLEQDDPDTYPTHYHVVFLDKNGSRTWLKSTSIRKYDPGQDEQTYTKGRDYKHQVSQAEGRANQALSMTVQERIKTFGFSHTFKGKIVDSQEYDEVVEPESDNDQDESEDDVELDLEILGLDVDEILEEAEALLSEAGETIQSLQDTSLEEEAPKKTKKSRKSQKSLKITNAEACKGNITKQGKTKRHYKKKAQTGVIISPEITDKKKKKHKLHHRSKKTRVAKEEGTIAESTDASKLTNEENCDSIGASESKETMQQSKVIDKVKEDGSAKMSKNQCIQRCLLNKEAARNTGEDEIISLPKTSEKKNRKPRVKKSGVEVDLKENPASALAEESTENSNQDSKKIEGDVGSKEKKIRKPRVKKSKLESKPKDNSKKEPVALKAEEMTQRAFVEESEILQAEKSDGASVLKEKKVRKPRVKKSKSEDKSKEKSEEEPVVLLMAEGRTEGNSAQDFENLHLEKSDVAAIQKEKKVRKPRVKKSDGEAEPKVKKPRVKKFAAKMTAEKGDESDIQKAESEKIQDVETSGMDSKPKVKKPGAKKANTKPSSVSDKTTEDMPDVIPPGASDNQDDNSKPKTKQKKKTSKAGVKMTSTFKPPSNKSKDVEKKPKKSSFAVPLMRKDEQLSKTIQKETKEDTLSKNMENQTSNALMPDEGRIESSKESSSTAEKIGQGDAVVTKQKAKKFSIKKASPLPLAKSDSSVEGTSTDANQISPAEPTGDANQNSEKLEKNPSKKVTAKKFSIKHKTPVSEDSSGKLCSPSPGTSWNKNPASKIKPSVVNDPKEETEKPSEKLSIKRKPSDLGEGTILKSLEDDKAITSPSPKKMKADQQEQCVDDEELLLNLDEDFLDDDTVLVLEDRQDDRADAGEDSDDFSMEDLEDWPKDQDVVDESSQGNASKLRNRPSGVDANLESCGMIEE